MVCGMSKSLTLCGIGSVLTMLGWRWRGYWGGREYDERLLASGHRGRGDGRPLDVGHRSTLICQRVLPDVKEGDATHLERSRDPQTKHLDHLHRLA